MKYNTIHTLQYLAIPFRTEHYFPRKEPFWVIGARKRPAEQPNGNLQENQRYPELPEDMGKIWSHWVGFVRGQKNELCGRSVEKNRFFGPKMQYFGPKIRFLIWDRDFRQWTVCSPRRCGRFGAFGSIFRFFVPELWPFPWPPGRKMTIFGHSYPWREVPLILARIWRNLVGSSG